MHRIFAQTDDGRELLEVFKKSLMTISGHTNGTEPYMLGLEEGRKDFIRKILLTIETIEKES